MEGLEISLEGREATDGSRLHVLHIRLRWPWATRIHVKNILTALNHLVIPCLYILLKCLEVASQKHP